MGLTFRLGQIPLAIQTDTSNNVGIGGAANASYKLQVTGATNLTSTLDAVNTLTLTGVQPNNIINYSDATSYARFYFTEGANYKATMQFMGSNFSTTSRRNALEIVNATTGDLALGTGDARTFFIKNGGNVGIGINPQGVGSAKTLEIGSRGLIYDNNDNFAIVNNGYNDGTWKYKQTGFAVLQATDGGNFSFSTATSGSINSTITFIERMRLTNNGALKVSNNGIYLSNTAPYHEFTQTNTDTNITILRNTAASPYGDYIGFSSSPNNTTNYFLAMGDVTNDKFIIWSNGSAVNRTGSYGTISDARYKENIIDATSKLKDIMQLRVRNFNMIGDSAKQIGFIAQEFEEVFPSMIDTSIDKESGNEYKSIKTSVLIPMLVKSIQELKAEIDELKNK